MVNEFKTDVENQAVEAAANAKVTSPARISETRPVNVEELRFRIEILEAQIKHLFQTYFRTDKTFRGY